VHVSCQVGLRLLGAFLDSVGKGDADAGKKEGGASAAASGGVSTRGSEDTKLVKRVVACLDVRCAQ